MELKVFTADEVYTNVIVDSGKQPEGVELDNPEWRQKNAPALHRLIEQAQSADTTKLEINREESEALQKEFAAATMGISLGGSTANVIRTIVRNHGHRSVDVNFLSNISGEDALSSIALQDMERANINALKPQPNKDITPEMGVSYIIKMPGNRDPLIFTYRGNAKEVLTDKDITLEAVKKAAHDSHIVYMNAALLPKFGTSIPNHMMELARGREFWLSMPNHAHFGNEEMSEDEERTSLQNYIKRANVITADAKKLSDISGTDAANPQQGLDWLQKQFLHWDNEHGKHLDNPERTPVAFVTIGTEGKAAIVTKYGTQPIDIPMEMGKDVNTLGYDNTAFGEFLTAYLGMINIGAPKLPDKENPHGETAKDAEHRLARFVLKKYTRREAPQEIYNSELKRNKKEIIEESRNSIGTVDDGKYKQYENADHEEAKELLWSAVYEHCAEAAMSVVQSKLRSQQVSPVLGEEITVSTGLPAFNSATRMAKNTLHRMHCSKNGYGHLYGKNGHRNRFEEGAIKDIKDRALRGDLEI